MTTSMHEFFNYKETPAHKVEFFDFIQLEFEEWFTNPLQDHKLVTDEQKIDFIDNKLMDAYQKENDCRWEETDQECLYEIGHVVCFDIKNTPENFQKLTDDPSYIYEFHHSNEEDWDFLDKDIIAIQIVNEWDWLILNRKSYSERFIEGFCSYYGIDKNDVISKEVAVNG